MRARAADEWCVDAHLAARLRDEELDRWLVCERRPREVDRALQRPRESRLAPPGVVQRVHDQAHVANHGGAEEEANHDRHGGALAGCGGSCQRAACRRTSERLWAGARSAGEASSNAHAGQGDFGGWRVAGGGEALRGNSAGRAAAAGRLAAAAPLSHSPAPPPATGSQARAGGIARGPEGDWASFSRGAIPAGDCRPAGAQGRKRENCARA